MWENIHDLVISFRKFPGKAFVYTQLEKNRLYVRVPICKYVCAKYCGKSIFSCLPSGGNIDNAVKRSQRANYIEKKNKKKTNPNMVDNAQRRQYANNCGSTHLHTMAPV